MLHASLVTHLPTHPLIQSPTRSLTHRRILLALVICGLGGAGALARVQRIHRVQFWQPALPVRESLQTIIATPILRLKPTLGIHSGLERSAYQPSLSTTKGTPLSAANLDHTYLPGGVACYVAALLSGQQDCSPISAGGHPRGVWLMRRRLKRMAWGFDHFRRWGRHKA